MKLKITVHGVAYEVEVEVLDPGEGFPAPAALPKMSPQSSAPTAHPAQGAGAVPRPAGKAPQTAAAGSGKGAVTSPIAGTVVELKSKPGEEVKEGQILLVIEAMKMNTSIAAPAAGKIKAIPVAVGDSVREGQTLVEFE